MVAAAQTKTGSVAALALADAQARDGSQVLRRLPRRAAARIADGGSLTLVSGFLSTRPSASAVLQGAINAALEALARGLALERAPVRVNAVSPGLVDTPLWPAWRRRTGRPCSQGAAERLPARRVGQPEDIAQAILFVATNPFATGIDRHGRRRRHDRVRGGAFAPSPAASRPSAAAAFTRAAPLWRRDGAHGSRGALRGAP